MGFFNYRIKNTVSLFPLPRTARRITSFLPHPGQGCQFFRLAPNSSKDYINDMASQPLQQN